MIVKVQRSIMPRDADCLIYNRAQSVMGQFPVTDEIREVMGDDMKGYFHAKCREGGGKVELLRRAPDQDW
jgi:hypothetical protein